MQARILVPLAVVLLCGFTLVASNLDLGGGSLRYIIIGLIGVGFGVDALIESVRGANQEFADATGCHRPRPRVTAEG